MGAIEKRFGDVIRELRQKNGVSQEKLGFDSGLHRTYISLIERGVKSPSLRTIFQISRALKVKSSVLLSKVERGSKSRRGVAQ